MEVPELLLFCSPPPQGCQPPSGPSSGPPARKLGLRLSCSEMHVLGLPTSVAKEQKRTKGRKTVGFPPRSWNLSSSDGREGISSLCAHCRCHPRMAWDWAPKNRAERKGAPRLLSGCSGTPYLLMEVTPPSFPWSILCAFVSCRVQAALSPGLEKMVNVAAVWWHCEFRFLSPIHLLQFPPRGSQMGSELRAFWPRFPAAVSVRGRALCPYSFRTLFFFSQNGHASCVQTNGMLLRSKKK